MEIASVGWCLIAKTQATVQAKYEVNAPQSRLPPLPFLKDRNAAFILTARPRGRAHNVFYCSVHRADARYRWSFALWPWVLTSNVSHTALEAEGLWGNAAVGGLSVARPAICTISFARMMTGDSYQQAPKNKARKKNVGLSWSSKIHSSGSTKCKEVQIQTPEELRGWLWEKFLNAPKNIENKPRSSLALNERF